MLNVRNCHIAELNAEWWYGHFIWDQASQKSYRYYVQDQPFCGLELSQCSAPYILAFNRNRQFEQMPSVMWKIYIYKINY